MTSTRRLLSLGVVLAWTAMGQTGPKLDDLISGALKESGAPSVSVAVTLDHKIVYAKAFGMADLEHQRAADGNTRYAVGSISKEFTAAALLLLQEQGKLSLDDKVSKYFPDLTRAGDITIRQILAHVSGYEDYAPQDYIIPEWTQPTTPRAILDRWAKKPLNFEPGTKWQYSNTNYVLAGEIFEKVAGVGLVDFLRTTFFQPLAMTTADECTEGHPAAGSTDAVAYTKYALGPPRPAKREAAGWYFAAGELCMVPSDLARWDIALLEKRILSAGSYEQFEREMRLNDGKATRYALGLQVGEVDGYPVIFHGGEVSGFLAINGIFPSKQLSVTVLSNEDNVNLIGPLMRKIARMYLEPPDAPATTASAEELKQVRGILAGLSKGKIDRALFTGNANSYFSAPALKDIQASMKPFGKLKTLARTSEDLRGGMTHRAYQVTYEKKKVSLNVYLMPDGKYEQLLVAAE